MTALHLLPPLILVGSAVAVVVLLRRAPEGYQDATGWHAGPEPCPYSEPFGDAPAVGLFGRGGSAQCAPPDASPFHSSTDSDGAPRDHV